MSHFRLVFPSAAIAAWGLVCGAAAYEHVAVIPAWTTNPPESIALFHGLYPLRADTWWQSIHPMVLATLIAALVSLWRSRPARRQMSIAIGGYILVLAVTAIYYVPELLALTTDPGAPIAAAEWKVRADRWEMLSLVRFVFMLGMFVFLSRALIFVAREQPAESAAAQSAA